jgi:hypothetical protein
MTASRRKPSPPDTAPALVMYLVPCSCGLSFCVPAHYDRQGGAWGRFLACPRCGKRHDPRNRLLQLGYYHQRYWTVDGC